MTDGVERQNPDGTWSPAEPLPYSPGVDVELSGRRAPLEWSAYRGSTKVGGGLIRTRLGLWLARRAWRKLGWRIFG
jgi:hypothetical protein